MQHSTLNEVPRKKRDGRRIGWSVNTQHSALDVLQWATGVGRGISWNANISAQRSTLGV